MRQRLVLFGLLVFMFGSLITFGRPAHSASAMLQDVPRLDGINIYFTEAGAEASRFDRLDPGISRFAGLLTELGANLYTLEWRTGFPTDADLIVIAGPNADLAPEQIARLWSYVNNNGRLLLLANPIVDPVRALPVASGLFQLMWGDMGIRARADVVVTEAGSLPAESAEGEAPAAETAALIANFATANLAPHPVTSGLSGPLHFFTARSLEVDSAIQGFTTTVLATSDSNFYGEAAYAAYLTSGTVEFNIGVDTTRGSLPLAAAFENPATGTRIVVVGDREFATNGGGLQVSPPGSAAFVYPDNARFMLNAVTWLLDRPPVVIDFPSPGPTSTPTMVPTLTPTPAPTAEPTPGS